jgi:hypothetical protein
MPTYTFRNVTTDEIEEHFMKMSEKDDFIKANPNLEPIIDAPVGIVRGIATKPDAGFREVLQNVKEKNSRGFYRSTVNTF